MLFHRQIRSKWMHTIQRKQALCGSKIFAIRNYSLALTRGVPNSFIEALSSCSDPNNPIQVERAKSQHDLYEQHLRTKLYTVSLPPSESYPDCPFIEDTVVALQKKIVINRIGAPSRQGEVDDVKNLVQNLGMEVVDMRTESEGATCDGGDVMVPSKTGVSPKHLFVGLSDRTNEEGVEILKKSFQSNVQVIAVPSLGDSLHLKTVITHLDEHTLIAPKNSLGKEMIQAVGAKKLGYQIIELPDPKMCNLVSVNGLVLAAETECEETISVLEQAIKERNMEIQYLNMNEFAKCDGSFTCLSVLLNLD